MGNWHHAPLHYVQEVGTYSVIGSTLYKQLFFRSRKRLDLLHDAFFNFAAQLGWRPQAWSFFPNHYHFVASCEQSPTQLPLFLNELHSMTARVHHRVVTDAEAYKWCSAAWFARNARRRSTAP